MPLFIYSNDSGIVFVRLFAIDRIGWNELQRIDFLYHAVVGFVGVWVLAGSTKELHIHYLTPGLSAVLSRCERALPKFKRRLVTELVESGDVEDEIAVWKREPHS